MNTKTNELGCRFNPSWDKYSGKQVTGLINLIEYVYNNKNNQIWCEIGSNIGESALLISSFNYIQKLYCIDPLWLEDQKIQFKKRTLHLKSKIEHINKTSDEASNIFGDNFFDVIYIDGNHNYEYIKRDLDFAMRVVKNNGFICGHDYSVNHIGVKNAVDELLSKFNYKMETFCDSSFAILKCV